MITISNIALARLRNLITAENCKAILFGVKSGGCSGMQYYFIPTNEPPEKYDEKLIKDNVEIHICGKSIVKVMGTHIDIKKDIMGEGFVFENPNSNNSCGCGASFN